MQKEPDLDDIESKAKAALAFQPEPPSDGWPDEPEIAPEWDATSGWLEDGGHAAFGRQHEYSDDQESDGADADAAYIKAADPATVLALVAECRRSRQQRREHAAMTALLRLASKPDWNVYSIDTDNWYAMENPPFGQLHREETAEELAVKLGVLELKEGT